MWPRVTTLGTITMTMQLGARDGLDESISYNSAVNFDPDADQWLDDTISGKFITFRFADSSSSIQHLWGFDVEWEWAGGW